MWYRGVILSTLLSLVTIALSAQERDDYQVFGSTSCEEVEPMIEIDNSLFRVPSTFGRDPYAEATQYYNIQGASQRRGLYYTTEEAILGVEQEYYLTLEEPTPKTEITLYTAQRDYRVGARASLNRLLKNNWSLSSSLWSQTGRDAFVEGVFRNTISPKVTLSKRFYSGGFLTIESSLYLSSRGMHYGSTPEVFELVGSNYYNPTWGFYDGKVRNSRVRELFSPSIDIHYQASITPQSTLIVESNSNYSQRSTSSIGWYNAATPTPDYYTKLPSALPEGEVRNFITNLWKTNDTNYTQVYWAELVRLNSISPDGEARYILEDRVERAIEGRITAVIHSKINHRIDVSYGAEWQGSTSRNFKVLDDLLGADHHTDYDQFIGDNYNKTLPLQNNLLNPDNIAVQGDRFGYDYSILQTMLSAILKANLRTDLLDISFSGRFGAQKLSRFGHFEKERFKGAASFGKSKKVDSSPYDIRILLGCAPSTRSYVALKASSFRLSLEERGVFLNEMSSNYLSPSISVEQINSVALSAKLNLRSITLFGELYALQSRGGAAIYPIYDDLSHTMCSGQVSEIGYNSLGIEVTALMDLSRDFKFNATLAAGRFRYDKDPMVELFDDYDLSTISSATPSKMEGLVIGNSPQVAATMNFTYFGLKRYILNLSSSYAALRYEQPSTIRRSERLLEQAFISSEAKAEACAQRRLPNIFDVEVSAMRFFYFEQGGRLSIRLAAKNLLGDNDRVDYARESNRIKLQSVDDYFSGSSLRESNYQYCVPRSILLSVGYIF